MTLNIEDTDTTMHTNAEELANAVIGHRIVNVETVKKEDRWRRESEVLQLTLDTGHKVTLRNTDDCCAFTELRAFVYNADKIDHIITGVGTTNDYETWRIYADMGDVLELTVGWSYGNPYYYGYGFDIEVEEVDAQPIA